MRSVPGELTSLIQQMGTTCDDNHNLSLLDKISRSVPLYKCRACSIYINLFTAQAVHVVLKDMVKCQVSVEVVKYIEK